MTSTLLPFPEMTAEEKDVFYQLQWRKGKEYAIRISELANATGLGERAIKDAVRTLRLVHMQLIGSRREPPYGYYMISTPEELQQTVHTFFSQAIEELKVVRALLGRDERKLRELLGQMEIELEVERAR